MVDFTCLQALLININSHIRKQEGQGVVDFTSGLPTLSTKFCSQMVHLP